MFVAYLEAPDSILVKNLKNVSMLFISFPFPLSVHIWPMAVWGLGLLLCGLRSMPGPPLASLASVTDAPWLQAIEREANMVGVGGYRIGPPEQPGTQSRRPRFKTSNATAVLHIVRYIYIYI